MKLDRVRGDPSLTVLEVKERDPRYDGVFAEPRRAPGLGHLAPPSTRGQRRT